MQRQWQTLERQATQQGWTYGQFLQALCELEQQQRYTSRVERYLKESGLPQTKSLANFDFSCCPSVNPAQILNLDPRLQLVATGRKLITLWSLWCRQNPFSCGHSTFAH